MDKGSEKTSIKAYEDMLTIWSSQDFAPLQVDRWYYMRFSPALSILLEHSPSASWIFDLRSRQFDFISMNVEEVLGYDAARFKSGGLDFCNQIKHLDDLERVWVLLRKIWDHLMGLPFAERDKYKYTYDYRILKPNGEEVCILEQNCVLQQDSKGNITHVLSICTDITSWKKHPDPFAAVSSIGIQVTLLITIEGHVSEHPQPLLSKREIEIIKLLEEGYSSKQIADKLCISFHTVNTHRQHMIGKTGCKNTSELLMYAKSKGFI